MRVHENEQDWPRSRIVSLSPSFATSFAFSTFSRPSVSSRSSPAAHANHFHTKQVAISGLSSELGQHSSLLASGQIDLWLVKGGPTLKTLGQDLVTYQAELELEIEAKATAAASA